LAAVDLVPPEEVEAEVPYVVEAEVLLVAEVAVKLEVAARAVFMLIVVMAKAPLQKLRKYEDRNRPSSIIWKMTETLLRNVDYLSDQSGHY